MNPLNRFITTTLVSTLAIILPSVSTTAAELLLNPREVNVSYLIAGQSPTLVIAGDVNVRNYSTTRARGGFIFARLDKGDEVYVLSCEGFNEDYFWVKVWIPEIGEIGYVVAEHLQSNYQVICDRTRP